LTAKKLLLLDYGLWNSFWF